MTVQEIMAEILHKARTDEALRVRLLATKEEKEPLSVFCQVAAQLGYDIGVMDIVCAGEEDYDLMRRSINGGGGNHNDLPGDSDPYEMLMLELQNAQ